MLFEFSAVGNFILKLLVRFGKLLGASFHQIGQVVAMLGELIFHIFKIGDISDHANNVSAAGGYIDKRRLFGRDDMLSAVGVDKYTFLFAFYAAFYHLAVGFIIFLGRNIRKNIAVGFVYQLFLAGAEQPAISFVQQYPAVLFILHEQGVGHAVYDFIQILIGYPEVLLGLFAA